MSALLASRQVCLTRPGTSARSTTVRGRPAPFTPARRVFVRAQEAVNEPVTDEEPDVVDEDSLADLEDAVYSAAVAEDGEEFVLDEDDEDVQAALQAGDAWGEDVDVLTASAVGMENDGEEDKEEASALYEAMLAQKMDDGELTEAQLEEVLKGAEALEAEAELDDFVPAMNSDRYDELPLSRDDMNAVATYKLSKGELRNLLPQDWDQINVDFFSNKKDENIPLPEFRLNVLWMPNNLAVAIDQVYSRGQVSPLTEYYFWPRQDAWEELRMTLEQRPWISERDRIILLNRLTQLINYWQDDEVKHSVEEARAEFPDCAFAIA